MTDQDEAARQAAELLPCPRANDFPRLGDCGFCHVCVLRPAVAERLANYREQLRQGDAEIAALNDRSEKRGERIAALEEKWKTALQFDEGRIKRINELEAENERLRAALDAIVLVGNEDGEKHARPSEKAMIRIGSLARAALAGRKP